VGNLGNISGKEAVKAFGRNGWYVVGQVGSHVMMSKPGQCANLSVPQHKGIGDWYASEAYKARQSFCG